MAELPLIFTGPVQVNAYRCIVIASGLRMWRLHKLKPNRLYTASAMMRAAQNLTGLKFASRDYLSAEIALRSLAQNGHVPPFDPPYTEDNCPNLAQLAKSS